MKLNVIKVKQDLADAVKSLHELLRRDYGCDYSFNICGTGHTIAKSNITGVQEPQVITTEKEG